jgi:Restriction endonuclease XhoI
MGVNLAEYEKKTKAAVKKFWHTRDNARKRQLSNGKADQGERSGVTAGKNMDGFLSLVKSIVHANGLKNAKICLKRRVLTLPGYFRPTKIWDLVVMNRGQIVAAIEFKSQVGPSFGNNFNNRTEEAIGTALDLWTAYREGGLGESTRPFVGWLMLLEDCDRSRSAVRVDSPHFPVFREFENASYANRYEIFCRKLVQEGLYTAASLIISPRSAIKTGQHEALSELTGIKTFVSVLAGHIASEKARTS